MFLERWGYVERLGYERTKWTIKLCVLWFKYGSIKDWGITWMWAREPFSRVGVKNTNDLVQSFLGSGLTTGSNICGGAKHLLDIILVNLIDQRKLLSIVDKIIGSKSSLAGYSSCQFRWDWWPRHSRNYPREQFPILSRFFSFFYRICWSEEIREDFYVSFRPFGLYILL